MLSLAWVPAPVLLCVTTRSITEAGTQARSLYAKSDSLCLENSPLYKRSGFPLFNGNNQYYTKRKTNLQGWNTLMTA